MLSTEGLQVPLHLVSYTPAFHCDEAESGQRNRKIQKRPIPKSGVGRLKLKRHPSFWILSFIINILTLNLKKKQDRFPLPVQFSLPPYLSDFHY